MSEGTGLERGYRRLLACYPRRFRDERGEELLAVLLTSARDGQHRPGLIESADLVRSGLGMRLRPDASPSARKGWSDALAIYSLVGPVLLVLTTFTTTVLQAALEPHPAAVLSSFWPGLWLTLASEAVIVALVMAGWRKTALAALVPVVALSWLAGAFPAVIPGVWASLWCVWSVCLLEAAALIASPGPRHGRRLVHWGYWAVLLPAVVAIQAACMFRPSGPLGGLGALAVMAIVILALNRLGRALRLNRYFRLLFAATFWPAIFGTASWELGGTRLTIDLGFFLVAVTFAGPLLCAAAAMGTAIRVRHRRMI